MGCTATARLTRELKIENDELENLRRELKSSAELRAAIDGELAKVKNTATLLSTDNDRLKQDLIIKAGDGGTVNASVFESAREEQERFKEWVESEIREGNIIFSSLLKLHGSDEIGEIGRQLKKQMDLLEDSDYAIEKLKEFSQWKYQKTQEELQGLTDDRIARQAFIDSFEEELKEGADQTDRDSGGKLRPQLAEIKAKLTKLPTQALDRFKMLKDLDKALVALRVHGVSEADGEAKSLTSKQAEEIKVLTQRLAAQKKLEDEKKAGAEKELSLKEVHIKHLENKVKDLSRPSIADSEVKAKDREIDRLKAELAKAKEDQKGLDEALEAAHKLTAELTEKFDTNENELTSLRG